MTEYWNPDKVAEVVSNYLKSKQGETEINFVVTFDEFGISSHPNHVATHKGIAKVFETREFVFDVLALQTVNIVRKYIGYVDIYNCSFDSLHYFKLTPIACYRAMQAHKS